MKLDLNKIVHNSVKKVLFENIEQETRTELDNGNAVEIDNFEEFEKLLSFNDPDDVYYVMICKRRKDNPNVPMTSHVEYERYYLIHDYNELLSKRSEIRMLCIKNNARAYITSNKRSLSTGMQWAAKYKADPRKYRGMQGHEIQMAFGRSFEDDIKRDVILIDIDTPDQSVHDKVHEILRKYKVEILVEYKSLNNGLHILTKSQEQLLDAYLCNEFIQFDGGQDLGKLATVGMDIDKYALLYCCLAPQGYRAATSYNPKFQAQSKSDAIKYRKSMGKRYHDITGNWHK